ncbi:MAG: O-antigen ligase family protein [Leptospiraceae bacterium]|nr:O-antigen ligase family protein [Leptospiraceae bacterium]
MNRFKDKLILILVPLTIWFSIQVFYFGHPIPKNKFYSIILSQFLFSLIPYFFNISLGRIFTVIGCLCLTRLGTILGITDGFITNAGFILGASVGLGFRQLVSKNQNNDSNKISEIPITFGILFFLLVLTLDRFLILFNAPYFRGLGIVELFYFKGISSRILFGYSIDLILGIFLPLVYFFIEERYAKDLNILSKDLKKGLWMSFFIQVIVILIQTFVDIDFLSQGTNQAAALGRATGLFRDTGSAAFIISIVAIFIFNERLKQITEPKIKFMNIIFMIVMLALIGFRLGRLYWFTIIVLFTMILFNIIKRKQIDRVHFLGLLLVSLIIISTIVIYLPIKYKFYESLNHYKASETVLGKISSIDPNRFYLNRVAWKLFTESPIFGNGVSSVLTNLLDSNFVIENALDIKDNAGNFFLGILSDIGVLGALVCGIWFLWNVYQRNSWKHCLLLLPGFCFGYHIVHPDSSFFVILFLTSISPIQRNPNKLLQYSRLLCFGISFCFFIHGLVQIQFEGKGPEFRELTIGSYQLFAYELNRTTVLDGNTIQVHNFKGKTIWKLAKDQKEKIRLNVVLTESTKKNFLRLKYSFLDKNQIPIEDMIVTAYKSKILEQEFKRPLSSEFLQVEELDENDIPKFFGDTIFSVLASSFNGKNEFQ